MKLAIFDIEIKHRTGNQHSNVDGMSRCPLLRCAQCEIHHPGAYETREGRKWMWSLYSQVPRQMRKSRKKGMDKVKSLLPALKEGEGKRRVSLHRTVM